jgi:hypothetical protein
VPAGTKLVGNADLVSPTDQRPTLAELGISNKQSALAQKVASLNDEDFRLVRDGSETLTAIFARLRHQQNAEIAKREEILACSSPKRDNVSRADVRMLKLGDFLSAVQALLADERAL